MSLGAAGSGPAGCGSHCRSVKVRGCCMVWLRCWLWPRRGWRPSTSARRLRNRSWCASKYPRRRVSRSTVPSPFRRMGASLPLSRRPRRTTCRWLWLRTLDSTEARPLAGTEGTADQGLAWSPDGRFIAFFSSNKLKKVEASGGPAADAVRGGNAGRRGVGFRYSDSVWNAGTDVPSIRGGRRAYTGCTAIDHSRRELGHAVPARCCLDGHHFLYMRLSIPLEAGGIYVGDLGQKPEQPEQEKAARRRFPGLSTLLRRRTLRHRALCFLNVGWRFRTRSRGRR